MSIRDYMEWELKPRELTKEEIANPYLVINDLFDFAHLPSIREMLWQWLKATVTSTYCIYLDRNEKYDLIYFYEKIQKLIEAAHLIHKEVKNVSRENESYESDCLLPTLTPQPLACPELIKPTLEKIISTCKADQVFLTSCYIDADMNLKGHACYDLLILLPGTANQPFDQYHKLLEETVEGVSISGKFLKTEEVHKSIKKGNIFYTLYCTKENLIHDSLNQPLPAPLEDVDIEIIKQKASNIFNEVLQKAKGFLQGAVHHLGQNQEDLASFMLHQATELAYRALLLSITGHNYTTHNLYKLRRKCMSLSTLISKVFPLDSEPENNLYALLQKAYIKARYKEDYHIQNEDLEVLLKRVNDLHLLIKDIFEKKLFSFEKVISSLYNSKTQSADCEEFNADSSCNEQDFHQL